MAMHVWMAMLPAMVNNTGAPARARDTGSVLLWVSLLLGLLIAGGLFAMWMRRRLLAADAAGEAGAGLLEGMRRMRDEGKISPEEYDSMRRAITRRSVAAMEARLEAAEEKKKGRSGTRTGSKPPITRGDA
ncbi:MAG: hypothetical protein KF864_06250 [Phycisphaeraceae bacterium]|nr:hypothetical protein [Phycisphaeraceae bacterium]